MGPRPVTLCQDCVFRLSADGNAQISNSIVATQVRTAIWRVSSPPGATTVHCRTGMMVCRPTRRRQLRCRCM